MSDRDKIELYKWISVGLFLLGPVVIFLVDGFNLHPLLNIIGFVVSIGGIVCYLIKVRCPHCISILFTKYGIPDYCPHCGKRIE
jgi:hypothetical protein